MKPVFFALCMLPLFAGSIIADPSYDRLLAQDNARLQAANEAAKAPIQDEQRFTVSDYEQAAKSFRKEGNYQLAAQATARAKYLRVHGGVDRPKFTAAEYDQAAAQLDKEGDHTLAATARKRAAALRGNSQRGISSTDGWHTSLASATLGRSATSVSGIPALRNSNPIAASPVYNQPTTRVIPRSLEGTQWDPNSLSNPYGAGSPYKKDGLMNPYSQYGSPYSNKSWTNPYATNAPKLYDPNGKYLGRLTTNPYAPDSVSNPYGKYGNPYSPNSVNNPYGAGNPYTGNPIYIQPQ